MGDQMRLVVEMRYENVDIRYLNPRSEEPTTLTAVVKQLLKSKETEKS
jgi:hypothetical protein